EPAGRVDALDLEPARNAAAAEGPPEEPAVDCLRALGFGGRDRGADDAAGPRRRRAGGGRRAIGADVPARVGAGHARRCRRGADGVPDDESLLGRFAGAGAGVVLAGGGSRLGAPAELPESLPCVAVRSTFLFAARLSRLPWVTARRMPCARST